MVALLYVEYFELQANPSLHKNDKILQWIMQAKVIINIWMNPELMLFMCTYSSVPYSSASLQGNCL